MSARKLIPPSVLWRFDGSPSNEGEPERFGESFFLSCFDELSSVATPLAFEDPAADELSPLVAAIAATTQL